MIKTIGELGLAPLVRAIIIYFSLGFSIFFIGAFAKKTGLSRFRTMLVTTIGYCFMILCALPNTFAFGGISGSDWLLDIFYVPLTMIHGLSYFVIVSVPLCKWQKLDYRRVNDLAAIGFILCQGLAHFGCVFFGCCHGYPSRFGVYNVLTQDYRFPVQILDGLSALLIFALLTAFFVKKKYDTGGILYPIMLVSYGTVRALWELARDNEKVLGPFSFNTLHCFFMIVFGILYLWLTRLDNRERAEARGARARRHGGAKK